MRATLARLSDHPAHARRLGGARPEDLRRLEDWSRLPFLTKAELRDAYPFALACGREQAYRRVHMSSGTTGNPILNPYTAEQVAREEQFDLASLSLRVGIFGSETWSDELRLRIERELAIQSFDIIGMTETGGPGMGIDCGARAGIHVWEDHYHPEIVDPATGAVVP